MQFGVSIGADGLNNPCGSPPRGASWPGVEQSGMSLRHRPECRGARSPARSRRVLSSASAVSPDMPAIIKSLHQAAVHFERQTQFGDVSQS